MYHSLVNSFLIIEHLGYFHVTFYYKLYHHKYFRSDIFVHIANYVLKKKF